MKYSSHNLHEPGIVLPLRFRVKVIVEYRPGGVLTDYAPMVYTNDPEGSADQIVKEKGWDWQAGYRPSDVWVDAGM